MLRQLAKRAIDDVVRGWWRPRVGDRIQFIRNPAYSQSKAEVQIGDYYTISYITTHNAGYSTDICVISDDGIEHRIEFFKKSDVRIVLLAGVRKMAV